VFLLATASAPPASNVAAAMRLKCDDVSLLLVLRFNKGESSALETAPYTFIAGVLVVIAVVLLQ